MGIDLATKIELVSNLATAKVLGLDADLPRLESRAIKGDS